MEISYTSDVSAISMETLDGFFVGWSHKPSNKKFLRLLSESEYRILALDGDRVVGFITAISDKTLAAYIPFLEVLPAYQRKGVGSQLMSRMLALLENFYMVDLLCDNELQPFYEKFGMQKTTGMMLRKSDKIQP